MCQPQSLQFSRTLCQETAFLDLDQVMVTRLAEKTGTLLSLVVQEMEIHQDALKSLEAKSGAWEYLVVHLLAELKTANPVAGIVLPKQNAVLD